MMKFLVLFACTFGLTGCTEAMKHSWNKEMQSIHDYDGENLMQFFGLRDFSKNTGWTVAKKPHRYRTDGTAPETECKKFEWQYRYVQVQGNWQMQNIPVCMDNIAPTP